MVVALVVLVVAMPRWSNGYYTLTDQSKITFREHFTKESICDASEEIREQNSVGWILFAADNYTSLHATLTQQRAAELDIGFVFLSVYSPTLNAIEQL